MKRFKHVEPMLLLSRQFLSYAALGILNNGFCYLLFLMFLALGLHYAAAAFCSTVTGLLVNFQVTGRIVFGNVFGNKDKSLIFRFFAVYGLIYVLNVLLLKVLSDFHIDVRIGALLLLPPLAVLPFLLNKFFVFNAKKADAPERQRLYRSRAVSGKHC